MTHAERERNSKRGFIGNIIARSGKKRRVRIDTGTHAAVFQDIGRAVAGHGGRGPVAHKGNLSLLSAQFFRHVRPAPHGGINGKFLTPGVGCPHPQQQRGDVPGIAGPAPRTARHLVTGIRPCVHNSAAWPAAPKDCRAPSG